MSDKTCNCTRPFGFIWQETMADGGVRVWKTCMSCSLSITEKSKAQATSDKPDAKPEAIPASVPAWMQFRHNVPGECPCGVPRGVCEYHREVRA